MTFCFVQCRFPVEKKAKLIICCMIFFEVVIQLRSTCKDRETKELIIGFYWIIMFKDAVYLLVLVSGLCDCTQSVQKSTCPWNNIKNMDHSICLKSSTSEFTCHSGQITLISHFSILFTFYFFINSLHVLFTFSILANLCLDYRFENFRPMHEIWKGYMTQLLKTSGWDIFLG